MVVVVGLMPIVIGFALALALLCTFALAIFCSFASCWYKKPFALHIGSRTVMKRKAIVRFLKLGYEAIL